MKYIQGFLKFSGRVNEYEESLEAEESRLNDLFKESSEALMAAIAAGTADHKSFLSFADSVSDAIEGTETKGALISKAKSFMESNMRDLYPLIKMIEGIPTHSAEGREAARIRDRFTSHMTQHLRQLSKAEDLRKKYDL